MKLENLLKIMGCRIWVAVVLCILATACSEDDIFTDNTIVVPPTESEEQNTDTLLIPDENLRLYLCSQLGVDVLTHENLATVTTLSLRSRNYSTLAGISQLENLDSLIIDNNLGHAFIDFPEEIADMKHLSYLKASGVFRGKLPASLSGFTYFSVASRRRYPCSFD